MAAVNLELIFTLISIRCHRLLGGNEYSPGFFTHLQDLQGISLDLSQELL